MSEKNRKSKDQEEKVLLVVHKKQIKSVREFREAVANEESLIELDDAKYGREINFSNIWDDSGGGQEI